jgi:hypothetical protein
MRSRASGSSNIVLRICGRGGKRARTWLQVLPSDELRFSIAPAECSSPEHHSQIAGVRQKRKMDERIVRGKSQTLPPVDDSMVCRRL